MDNLKNNDFLFKDVSSIPGVGKKLSKYLKNKKIEKINDLIWDFPGSFTDRSKIVQLDCLEVGKIFTLKIKVIKYNFPRIRNLPNKVICEDEKGKIDIIFFNSRENYIKAVMPLNNWIIVSGKIGYYNKKYQITNPDYITSIDKIDFVKKKVAKYSLTEGLNEKSYRKIIDKVINNIPDLNEWINQDTIKKFKFKSWKESVLKIHSSIGGTNSRNLYYRRLAFDEILSNLIILSKNRKKIMKKKKKVKIFKNLYSKSIIKNLNFKLTNNQNMIIDNINSDLKSSKKMFRLLQGDVGSGKTIVSLITLANVIESGYQTALMAPTDILARQHYELAKKIFNNLNIKVSFLSGKVEYKKKKDILDKVKNNEINLLIGTHALFQNKIKFNKLGYVIIDEQHKFGVKQRMKFAEKGGSNCDVLLMSATPIPRTMILTIYGDMDISQLKEKPNNRLPILTYSKPEKKLFEIIKILKKNLTDENQIFWVCPLIKESKILNYSSAIKRFDWLNKIFPNQVELLHGNLDKEEKEIVLDKFLNKKIKILVSTTVIEVGIDFPSANLIIIENANKFGLAQLHQLRGRVGRGNKQGVCILLFKENLSKNSVKRIKILKESSDGFFIAEEDMKLRGFGDMIGYQQSGEKYFKIADPLEHEDLFLHAEKYIKKINDKDLSKFDYLLKIFDKADIIVNHNN